MRPYGYVEEGPVARRIGDRDLYLGNESASDLRLHDRPFTTPYPALHELAVVYLAANAEDGA